MDKAFDVVFQTQVDAEVLAKTSYFTLGDKFRYQCLCCGEEVYLAAADSTVKAPHFRHRRGNNDKDCERYLGQPGAVEHYISLRKHNKEHIGFCFNIEHMTFEISVMYTAEEIDEYAMNRNCLSLYTKYNAQSFFSVPIDRSNFIPDTDNFFTLKEYANDYYVSIDAGNVKMVYADIIKKDCKLNIYRIKQSNFHYKRNTSDILYTNYTYLAICENMDTIREMTSLRSVEVNDDIFSFTTQGRQFYALKFTIRFEDYSSGIYFQKHGLRIENSETMDILWPPVFTRDSVSVCTTEKVYISSSFELIPHGNIEANSIDKQTLCDGVCEVTFKDLLIICEKNVECRIVKEKSVINKNICEKPQITYTNKYIVPDIYDYYMFDKNGCSKLTIGSKVYLSSTDRIIGYKNGHVKNIVLAALGEKLNKKLLINDIIKYHPQSERFEPDDFMDVEADETILSYIESCYRNGQINTVIKQYIKEGLI